MAFGNVLRRSASAVVPLAIRAIGGQRYHHCSALLSAVNHRTLSRSSFPSILHYSSTSKRPSSDESLLRVIETEIKCAQESEDHDQVIYSTVLFIHRLVPGKIAGPQMKYIDFKLIF